MKACSKCKVVKSSTDYYRHIRTPDGLQRACKACVKNHNDEYKSRKAELHRRNAYGVSKEQYEKLQTTQQVFALYAANENDDWVLTTTTAPDKFGDCYAQPAITVSGYLRTARHYYRVLFNICGYMEKIR